MTKFNPRTATREEILAELKRLDEIAKFHIKNLDIDRAREAVYEHDKLKRYLEKKS